MNKYLTRCIKNVNVNQTITTNIRNIEINPEIVNIRQSISSLFLFHIQQKKTKTTYKQ